jgi:hypothetical protein
MSLVQLSYPIRTPNIRMFYSNVCKQWKCKQTQYSLNMVTTIILISWMVNPCIHNSNSSCLCIWVVTFVSPIPQLFTEPVSGIRFIVYTADFRIKCNVLVLLHLARSGRSTVWSMMVAISSLNVKIHSWYDSFGLIRIQCNNYPFNSCDLRQKTSRCKFLSYSTYYYLECYFSYTV